MTGRESPARPADPQPWQGELDDAHRARQLFLFLLLAAFSAVLGFNLVFFPPLFLFGALFGLAATVAIFMRPFLGLLLYVAVFVIRPAEIWPVLAFLRLERVVGVVTLLALFLEMFRREGRFRLDRSGVTGWLALFLAAVYASMPFSFWPSETLNNVVELLKLIAFYLMVVHLVDRTSRLRVFVGAYALCIGYVGVTSLLAYLRGDLVIAQGIERAVGLTSAGGDPNALGATLGCTVPLALYVGWSARSGWLRVLLWTLAAALLVTVAFTGSRSSILGTLAMFGAMWWLGRNRWVTGILGVLLLAGLFVALPDSYKDRYRSIGQSQLDDSSKYRLLTWEAGLHMVLDRPITGVGAGAFSAAHAAHYSLDPSTQWLQSHSLYVQVPAEVGLFGSVAFFGFLFAVYRLNRRTAGRLRLWPRDVRFELAVLDAVFAGFVFLLVYSIFSHTMFRFTWFVFAGLSVAIYRLARTGALTRRRAPAAESAPDPVPLAAGE